MESIKLKLVKNGRKQPEKGTQHMDPLCKFRLNSALISAAVLRFYDEFMFQAMLRIP